MLRVILSAYACEPGRGSEPGIGWNVARELSSRVVLRVVTRSNNRDAIEKCGEDWISRVEWIYWDPPTWATFWKRGNRGIQLFYILWQWGVKEVVRESLRSEDADIIHHLTFGKYWIPSRLAGLDKPFVFGPVGGGEEVPADLKSTISLRGKISETVKIIARHTAPRIPSCEKLLKKAAWTYAATSQTKAKLNILGITDVSIMAQSGICTSNFSEIAASQLFHKEPSSKLVFVTAARLIHWKAINIAIEALAIASKHAEVKLIVLQTGPELRHLAKLAQKLGVNNLVEFKGELPSLDEVYEMIAQADALVHPALHEAFGQVCLEALALGTPVICLNWCGPSMIVNEHSGIRIEPSDKKTTVKQFAEAMLSIKELSTSYKISSASCIDRAKSEFSWGLMADEFVNRYHLLIGNN